ncbi:unnamed protein product, partial [Tilletia caries]
MAGANPSAAIAADAEAEAIQLIAQYHFGKVDREEVDTKLESLQIPPNIKRAYKMFRTDLMQAEEEEVTKQLLKDFVNYDGYVAFIEEHRVEEEAQQAENLLGSVAPKPPPNSGSPSKGGPQKRKQASSSALEVPGKRTRPTRKSASPSRLSDFQIESHGKNRRGRVSGAQGKQYGRDNEGQESDEEEDFSDDDGNEEEEGDDDEDGEEDDEDESEEEDSLRTPKRATGKAGAVGGSTSVKGKGKAVAKKPKSKGVKKKTSSITKRGRTSGVKLTPLTAQEKSEFDASGSQTSRLIQAPKKKAMLSKAAQDSLDGVSLKAKGYFGFKFSHMESEGGKIREKWICLFCLELKTVPKGKNNNLGNHRGCCPFNLKPKSPGLEPYYPPGSKRAPTEASNMSEAGVSYRGRSLKGWLSGDQVLCLPLVRRMGLIEIITDAQPFTHMASPAHIALVSSIDPNAVAACVSHTTVRRDLELLTDTMKVEVMRILNEQDSLVTLQHDAWTMRGYRFAFVAIIATYVDRDWNFRSLLLSFRVLDTRHSGASFARHLVETIQEFYLEDKWSGLIVSDSASPNRRMAAVLQQELAQRNDKVKFLAECLHGIGDGQAAFHHEATNPNPFASATHDVESSGASNSVSAFPKASRRSNFVCRADDCGILCFAHHLNIAIRDAFNAMGTKFAAQMKVIPIPEIVEPALDSNLGFSANSNAADEGGMDTAADTADIDDEGPEERFDTTPMSEHAPPSDERGGEDDDDEDLVFLSAGQREELINRLGDGPSEDVAAGTGGAWSAVKRVEGFVVALHRSAERIAAFRAVM